MTWFITTVITVGVVAALYAAGVMIDDWHKKHGRAAEAAARDEQFLQLRKMLVDGGMR